MRTVLTGIVALLICLSARAESENYAQIYCDTANSELSVSELWVEDALDLVSVPKGAKIKPMYYLVKTVTGEFGEYMVKEKEWSTTCRLGAATYEVLISPWKYNSKMNGMCGGGSPSVELSL